VGVRRDTLRRITVQFVLLTLLTSGLGHWAIVGPDASGVAQAVRATGQECPDAQERAFLVKINRYRKSRGLKPLQLEKQLMLAANNHSEDMTGMGKVVDHTLSDGTSAKQNLIEYGYPADAAYWGENLALGTNMETAGVPFSFWSHSQGHNRNMLNKHFHAIGIARVYDERSKYQWYWTTTFGSTIEVRPTC